MMETQLTIIFLILGVLLIAYILFDGYRKARKKLAQRSASVEVGKIVDTLQQADERRDYQGFDSHGLSEPRVKPDDFSQNNYDEKNDEEKIKEQTERIEPEISDLSSMSEENRVQESDNHLTGNRKSQYHEEPLVAQRDEPITSENIIESENMFDSESIGLSESKILENDISENINMESITADKSLKTGEQTDFIQSDLFESFNEEEYQEKEDVEQDLIFSVTLLAKEETPFSGYDVLQCLVENGFKHGEMNIFHLYKNPQNKTGKLFSVANAFNPGIFNLDTMSEDTVKGLTFFMAISGFNEPEAGYRKMVETVNKCQIQLGGQMVDSTKSTFTEQTYRYDIEKIIEYKRRKLVSA